MSPLPSMTRSGATLEPWQPATVGASFDGVTIHFSFGIPRGTTARTDSPAATPRTACRDRKAPKVHRSSTSSSTRSTRWSHGSPPPSKRASTARIYTSHSASRAATMAFKAPRNPWQRRHDRPARNARKRWATRPQGPPGPQDLSGTAVNSSILSPTLVASDPPTQGELQQVIDKLNELRRPI